MRFYGLLLLAFTLFATNALADNFHLIKGVAVEATAKNATIARNKAIRTGEKNAFSQLMRGLLPNESEIPEFTNDDIKSIILSRQIRNEKISSSSYKGIIDVKFSKQRVKEFLREKRLNYAKSQNESVLILPVFRTEDKVSLWEDVNPWKRAWEGATSNFVSFVIPRGDIDDVTTANKYDVIKENTDSLENLALKYGVKNVAIVEASYEIDENTNTPTVNLKTKYFNGMDLTKSEKVVYGEKNESQKDLLKRAVLKATDEMDNLLKQGASTNIEAGLQMLIPIKSISEWSEIRQKLANIKQVESVKFNAVAYGQVDIGVVLLDSPQNLILQFRQNGLNLSQDGDYWILTKSELSLE